MLLMIDNYDSFTYNLVQYFGELGEDVRVARNDQITLEEIAALNPDRICVSPGLLAGRGWHLGARDPGLRRQEAHPGRVPGPSGDRRGFRRRHRARPADHARQDRPHLAHRHRHLHRPAHALHGDPIQLSDHRPGTLPDCLAVTATAPDGDIMGVRHKTLPLYGVQFHPSPCSASTATRCCAIS